MNIDVTGRRVELTPEIRSYAEEKLGKLGRLLNNLEIHVTLSAEKHRFTCGVVAQGKGTPYAAEQTSKNLLESINDAVDVLARQIRKDKTAKLADRREGAESIRRPEEA